MIFTWFEECEISFQKIKSLLTSAPALTLPKECVDFTVYCDVSRRWCYDVEGSGDCICI